MRENRISVFRKHTLGILVALGMVLFGSVFILFTNIGKNRAFSYTEETLRFLKEKCRGFDALMGYIKEEDAKAAVRGYVEDTGQLHNVLRGGNGYAHLPCVHAGSCNAQPTGQLRLRHLFFLPQGLDAVCHHVTTSMRIW